MRTFRIRFERWKSLGCLSCSLDSGVERPHRNATRLLILSASALLAFAGCNGTSTDVPANGFHLSVQEIVADDSVRVSQLAIRSSAAGTISVDVEGSHQSASLDESTAGKGSVTLMASLVAPSGQPSAYIQSLIRIQTGGVTTGGPAMDALPKDTRLSGFFAITAKTGNYPFDTPVEIATLRGKPVVLTLKRAAQ
jgi:hypothetical protein